MKFSLIVPVYNVAKYLPACLDSILAQTCPDFEAILVDDGATDNSGEICAAYARKDERFKVVTRPNGGLSAARNTGLREARGEFLVFVDSDDWVEPDMLANYASEIAKWPDVDNLILIAGYNKIWEKKDIAGVIAKVAHSYLPEYAVMSPRAATIELLEDYSFCNYMWNKCYSARLFQEVWFPEGMIYEDLPTQPLLFPRADTIVTCPFVAYNYRLNRAGQICGDKSIRNEASYLNSLILRHGRLDEAEFLKISSQKIFSGLLNFLDKTWQAECAEQVKDEVRRPIIEKLGALQQTMEPHLSPMKKSLLRYALRGSRASLRGIILFNRVNYHRHRLKRFLQRLTG